MTNREKIIDTLKEALPSLKKLKDNFYIIGSSALILSDIEIDTVSDIDVLTTENDADFLRLEWASRIVDNYNPIDSELFSSKFSRNKFSGLDIEIMGGLKVNVEGKWRNLEILNYDTISIEDLEIKIPTLKEQKRILNVFGRRKDLEKLDLINDKAVAD